MIFFGLVFSSIASIIFSLRCPSLVKRYQTSREFFSDSNLFYTHPHNLSWMLDNINELQGFQYRDEIAASDEFTITGALSANHAHTLSGPMSALFNILDHGRSKSRKFTFWCYIISATFLLVPTAYTIFQVGRIGIKRLVC